MKIETVSVADQANLFELFKRCFGTELHPAIWQWKYGYGAGVGVVAREGNELIAHYGALVRRVYFFGEEGQALAPMDVMVAPEKRGILTRQNGLMAQTARYLFAQYFGDGKPCRLAMGFPTRRARTLGARLGLYIEQGRVVDELSWQPRWRNWYERLRYQAVHLASADLESWVNPAWQAMAADFQDLVIGVRDADWVRYRYFQHPLRQYIALGIRERLTRRRLGVAIVREDEDGALECLDLIAPRSLMPPMVMVLRHYCRVLGRKRMYLWVQRLWREALMTADVEVFDRDTVLTVTTGPKSEDYARQWWITSGDTDFR